MMRGYAVIHQEKKLKMEPVGGASAFNALANFVEELQQGSEITWEMIREGYEQWNGGNNQPMDQYLAQLGLTEEQCRESKVIEIKGKYFAMEENDLEQANRVLNQYYPKAEVVEIVFFGKSKK